MRRAHRRAHLALWLAMAPASLAALVLALHARPSAPVADLPSSIAGEAP